MTVNNIADIALTCSRFPDISRFSRFSRQVVTLNTRHNKLQGYVHTDKSGSRRPGFHLRVVCHSYKLHQHEWSVHGHLYKHVTQRIHVYVNYVITS